MRTSDPGRSSSILAARHVWPALCVLLLQVAFYAWMAPRGFEFTDESYYLHNFAHWREFTGTVTFFGAYFEWPFRLMASSIAGMRMLSLCILLASAALLAHEVLRFAFYPPAASGDIATAATAPRSGAWYIVAPMASAMLFFGYFSTVRAPSYNLLSLCAMAVMSACMLRALEPPRPGAPRWAAPFVYGLALGACFLSKATTALVAVLAHLAFFVAVNRHWKAAWLLRLCLLVVAGFALNFIVLTLAFPGWLASLREGMEILRVRDGSYEAGRLLDGLRWDLQAVLPLVAPWLLGGGVLLFLVRNKLAAASRTTVSVLVLGLVGLVLLGILAEYRGKIWLIAMVAGSLGLWGVERAVARGRPAPYDQRRELALMALLFVLPLGFSFGTNLSVLAHSVIASMFAFCALYLRLYRLFHQGMLHGGVLAACMVLLCAPALLTQWLALTDVRYTFRQAAPLDQQDVPVTLGTGSSVVKVDPLTGRSLQDLLSMAGQAGMAAGQDVLDLSGDGPGVLYAIGANPLGSPWMSGGYPGSAAAVERIVQKVEDGRMRSAWLLTSANNPRRIKGWEGIVERRIGPASHRLAATVTIANPRAGRDKEPPTLVLQLWKPDAAPQVLVQQTGAGSPQNDAKE